MSKITKCRHPLAGATQGGFRLSTFSILRATIVTHSSKMNVLVHYLVEKD